MKGLLLIAAISTLLACSSSRTGLEECTAVPTLLVTSPGTLRVFDVQISGTTRALRVVGPAFELVHGSEGALSGIATRSITVGEKTWLMDVNRPCLFAATNRIAALEQEGAVVFALKPGWFQVRMSYLRTRPQGGGPDVCVATSAAVHLPDERSWQVEDDPFSC
jgi:hypothetical protein